MSVTMLRVASPCTEISSCLGFSESIREGFRFLDSSRSSPAVLGSKCNGVVKGKRPRLSSWSHFPDLKYSCFSGSENSSNSPVISSLVANPAGEMAISSEQKVYDVVLKQAALVKEQLRSGSVQYVKPEMVIPGSLNLLNMAYDRCGEVCAEYAKTFYLGTLLMTPERRKAIWAIYVWCRSFFSSLIVILFWF